MRMRPLADRRLSARLQRRVALPRLEAMEDRLLLTTYTVTDTLDDLNKGSLRWAITQANGGAGGDTIDFDIPLSSGGAVIALGGQLPALVHPTTIDATTEPGYAGTPLVEIDGKNAGLFTLGLEISGGNSTVKGLSIINCSGAGIWLTNVGHDTVQGNYFGIGLDGVTGGSNGDGIVVLGISNNLIGGSATAGQGNIISANSGFGIHLQGGDSNTVQGNLVGVAGTAGTGTVPDSNSKGGIYVDGATKTLIGGTTLDLSNVVGANEVFGIQSFGVTTGLVIEGNFIGTDRTQTVQLGNHGYGVELFSSGNTVGGTQAQDGNVIAYNGDSTSGKDSGVVVLLNNKNNTILSNSIYSNVGLGINLSGTGNNNQQPPTLSAASTDGTTTTIAGTLSGTLGTTYTLQFFANASPDASGFGEGQTYLGSIQTTPGAFTATLPVTINPQSYVSATATDPSGNTSQFAQDVVAKGTADLGVTIQSTPSTVNAGDQVTYKITVTNNGPQAASGVSIIDSLPLNATLVSANATGATVVNGANTVTFNFTPALTVGQSFQATVVVQTSTGSVPSITDSATVKSNESDPVAPNDSFVVTTNVSPVADLAVGVKGTPGTVSAGQNVTYTVTLSNNGPAQATGITLTDTLPQNVMLVSALASQGTTSLNGDVVTVTLPSLDAAATPVTLTLVVTTTGATAATITDSASVTANQGDSNTSNNSGSASTTVTPSADLAVAVQASPDPVQVGQNLTYTVTATNNGPSPATLITLSDELPAGVTFVSASDSLGGSPSQSSGTVIDQIASLAAGSAVTLTIVVVPTGSAASQIQDSATVTGTESDPNLANNSATAATDVTPVADVELIQSGSPPVQVDAGQTVEYDFLVRNNGPSPATGVTLTDTLPAGVTVVSASSSQGTVTQGTGTVVADFGDLAPALPVTFTVIVKTTASNPPSITSTAVVSGNELDPNPGNNTITATTAVNPAADLGVSVSPPASPVLVGQQLSYTLTVTNNGPSTATGVNLVDTLPAGVALVSAKDSLGKALSALGGSVTDAIGTLSSGGTVTVTLVVATATGGSLVNQASVSGNEHDEVADNNTVTTTTTVLPVANLSVEATADQAEVTVGHPLKYKAVVTNNGPSPATGVTLSLSLPTGAQVVSVDASQGSTSSSDQTLTDIVGELAPGAAASLTVVVMPTVVDQAVAQAKVTASEVDPDPSDNESAAAVNVVPPPGTLGFASSGITVNETAGLATLIVNRTDGAEGTVSVRYTTVPLTATPGLDFTPVSGLLVFNQGVTAEQIVVPVLANPHDRHDELVRVVLSTPEGGAVLGPQTTATVTIHDIDPDVVPPQVQDVRLYGPASSVGEISLFFSEGLNPARARNARLFQLIDVGPDGRLGTGDDRGVPLKSPLYNPVSHQVILQPAVPLKSNEFYYVRAMGQTDLAGNLLVPGAGSLPGPAYGIYFARGTALTYPDSQGTRVSLSISGGGVLDLTRYGNGNGERLQVLGAMAGRTEVSGKVSGGSRETTLDSMTGLGYFGQVRVNMTTPPIYVRHMPFDRRILSPAAVDGIVGPVVSTRVRAASTTKPNAVARAVPSPSRSLPAWWSAWHRRRHR